MPIRPLIGYALVVTCVLALIATGINMDFKAPDWAAWVQAVGSIVAIIAAFAISDFQLIKQRRQAAEREVEETARLLTFADAVLKDAIDASQQVEKSLRQWSNSSGYIYHDAQQVDAAIVMLRMLLKQPLPTDVLKPAMLAHTVLLDIDASGKYLIGQGNFAANSRFTLFWTERNKKLTKVAVDMGRAIVIFNSRVGRILVHPTV